MILSNSRRCTACNTTIFSTHQHDYVTCQCKKVMVDGGMAYLRQSIEGVDMNIVVDEVHVRGMIEAITDPTKQPLGHVCNLVRYLRDEMGINISEPKDVTCGQCWGDKEAEGDSPCGLCKGTGIMRGTR